MESAAIDIFLPVMESAMVLAGHYAKACGRDVVLAEDVRIGLMFSVRNVTGRQLGSLFPEVYEEDSDSGSDDANTISDEDYEWTRYNGPDDLPNRMNACMDTWDEWEPESPAERALKNAVDKQRSS
jgi:hypothetical protein